MCFITIDWKKSSAEEKIKAFQKRKELTWGVIEVTNQCNFDCVWCYANSGPEFEDSHMPFEKVKQLLELFHKLNLKQVTFSGGEPLTYPHIKEAIALAKSYGLIIHMNTNGYFLTEKLARELREAGLDQVQINIDSLNAEEHDKGRGMPGSWDRSIQALLNAKMAGIDCTSQTVLTKDNENKIFDIFKFALAIGLHRTRVWDMTPSEGRGETQIDTSPTNYISTLEKIAEFAYQHGAVNIESYEPLFPLNSKPKVKISCGFCVAKAGLVLFITCNGDAIFCCAKRVPMYNVFQALEKHKIASEFQKHHKKKLGEFLATRGRIPKKCLSCTSLAKCKGGCITRVEFNNYESDYCCDIMKKQRLREKLGEKEALILRRNK